LGILLAVDCAAAVDLRHLRCCLAQVYQIGLAIPQVLQLLRVVLFVGHWGLRGQVMAASGWPALHFVVADQVFGPASLVE